MNSIATAIVVVLVCRGFGRTARANIVNGAYGIGGRPYGCGGGCGIQYKKISLCPSVMPVAMGVSHLQRPSSSSYYAQTGYGLVTGNNYCGCGCDGTGQIKKNELLNRLFLKKAQKIACKNAVGHQQNGLLIKQPCCNPVGGNYY